MNRFSVRENFASVPTESKMLRLSVLTNYHTVLTNSQNDSTFCPSNFSFCTSKIKNWFGFLSVKFCLLYQPNHTMLRFFVRTIFPSALTKSQNGSGFCPNNFYICTNRITKWFRFLSVHFILLYQPIHKKIRLSLRTVYLFVLTNSQKASPFCSKNFSFCTSQIR